MGKITGQDHYCVRCHNRPIPNEIWRAGGPASRLCEVCCNKPKISNHSPNPREFYLGDGKLYRDLKARWTAYRSGFLVTRYMRFDDTRNMVSTNISRDEMNILQDCPTPPEE